MDQSRREFVKLAAVGAVGIATPLSGIAGNFKFKEPDKPLHITIFSKHLQFLGYEDMCDAAKEMGFDGIDLTVRPKGHVLPEMVEEDLPKATEAMKKYGYDPIMFSSNVKDASNAMDKMVLATAGKLGYQFYRPAWYKYGKNDDIRSKASEYINKIVAQAELAKSNGIAGSYHNHSGHYFGASVWDLNEALEATPRDAFGIQYDIMHGVIEGGKNWEVDFRLIKDKINTIVIKDFKWSKTNGKWDREYVPMGEGMVDFASYLSLLKKYKINVPVSMHFEYIPDSAKINGKSSIERKEVFSLIKKDLDYVRDLWSKTSI